MRVLGNGVRATRTARMSGGKETRKRAVYLQSLS